MIETETALLGAVLRDSSLLLDIDVEEEDFQDRFSQQVFGSILNLVERSEPVDVFTVAGEIKLVGNRDRSADLHKLILGAGVPQNVKHYAEVVRTRRIEERAAGIAVSLQESVRKARHGAIDTCIRDLMELQVARRRFDHTAQDMATRAMTLVMEADETKGGVTGISTGLTEIDRLLGGLHDSDLMVVGARTGVGKTSWLLNLALASDKPVGFISAEQSNEQLGMRLLAIAGGVSLHAMRGGSLTPEEWPKVTEGSSHLREREIYVNDQPRISLAQLMRQARRWKHHHSIGVLFVDYIQRMRGKGETRRDQVSDIVIGLKEVARELHIPVVAAAQVNRSVMARDNKRPMVSDLMESGVIEQEADEVLLLYRDEVYNFNTPDAGIMEVLIGKNRHGPLGEVKIAWDAPTLRGRDLAAPWLRGVG